MTGRSTLGRLAMEGSSQMTTNLGALLLRLDIVIVRP
jgi:hypothetical protein